MRRVPDVGLCERLPGVRANVNLEDWLSRTIARQRSVTVPNDPA